MIFTANILDKTWKITDEHIHPGMSTFSIGFVDGEKDMVLFDKLSFGITLKSGEQEISFSLPKEGVEYISTDQETVESFTVITNPKEVWDVFVWAENSKEFFSKDFSVTIPQQEKPFSSWTWNEEEEMWEPPTPIPNDSGHYDWDEESLAWKKSHVPLED